MAKRMSWTEEQINEIKAWIASNNASQADAAKQFKVPVKRLRSALSNYATRDRKLEAKGQIASVVKIKGYSVTTSLKEVLEAIEHGQITVKPSKENHALVGRAVLALNQAKAN